jgi:hypothetical protein
LGPLPILRYDTAYIELRQVAWDSYIEVRGNRYSVPANLVGQQVTVHIGLDNLIKVYHSETLVAAHRWQAAQDGWATVPEHHASLWRETLQVEQRPLEVYEEVVQWS